MAHRPPIPDSMQRKDQRRLDAFLDPAGGLLGAIDEIRLGADAQIVADLVVRAEARRPAIPRTPSFSWSRLALPLKLTSRFSPTGRLASRVSPWETKRSGVQSSSTLSSHESLSAFAPCPRREAPPLLSGDLPQVDTGVTPVGIKQSKFMATTSGFVNRFHVILRRGFPRQRAVDGCLGRVWYTGRTGNTGSSQ